MSSSTSQSPAAQGGAQGFDADETVSLATAQAAVQAGFAFCVRTLALDKAMASPYLTPTELDVLLDAGLCVMAMQVAPGAGWSPSGTLGTTYGKNAVLNAVEVGLSPGICLWCDLNNVTSSPSSSEVVDYVNNWATAVQSAGYVPGLLVNLECGLSAEQLEGLKLSSFWQGESDAPYLSTPGYQMTRTNSQGTINGQIVGVDQAGPDQAGDEVIWMTPEHVTGSP